MRKSLYVPALLFAFATAGVVSAAGQKPDVLEQQVFQAQRELTQAQADCTPDRTRLRMPDDTIITSSGSVLTGEERMRENDARCRKTKPAKREDMRIRIYNGTTAVITGLQTTFEADGTARPKVRFTSVWVKSDGEWRQASYQATLSCFRIGGVPVRPADC